MIVKYIFGLQTCRDVSPDNLDRIAPVLLADTNAWIRMGYWDQASDHVAIYSHIHENDPQAIYLKGKIEQQRQPDNTIAAVAYYKKPFDLKPDFAPAHLALGMMHDKAGRLQTALGYFETSLELEPDNPENAYIRQYLKPCLEHQPKS